MKPPLPEHDDGSSDRRTAVALRYRSEVDAAPKLVAKGRGDVADRILEAARASGVPVSEDRDLVQMLSMCELGAEIPEELYTAVAELLTYLHGLNKNVSARRTA